MPCLLGCLSLLFPRLVILLLAIFSTAMSRSFDHWLWPVLGFLFMPYTTLAVVLAMTQNGSIDGVYLVVVIVAVLADIGSFGGSGKAYRRRWTGKR